MLEEKWPFASSPANMNNYLLNDEIDWEKDDDYGRDDHDDNFNEKDCGDYYDDDDDDKDDNFGDEVDYYNDDDNVSILHIHHNVPILKEGIGKY